MERLFHEIFENNLSLRFLKSFVLGWKTFKFFLFQIERIDNQTTEANKTSALHGHIGNLC